MLRRYDRKLAAAAEAQAHAALELWKELDPAIDQRGVRRLYEDIELPLAAVLARMHRTGIRIDPVELRRLSALMERDIARLTSEIYALAGKTFNIASPQQLGRVLFEDLKLPAPVKYGKGKTISTAADVLEELAPDHEIVRKVLEYRQLTKLKGTYVDALPALINPADGRLHTTFNQTGAATGRLSSSDPNLQNIPIRTELGREIRAAFVPREGWKLVAADYSQIELRVLAHFSKCPVLVDAFRRGEDIHTRTAAEVMGVPPLMVTLRYAPRREDHQLRHRLRHQPVRPGGAVGHFARRGGAVHQELLRAVRGGEAVHRRDRGGGAADGRDAHAVRPRAAHPGYQQPQPEPAGLRRAHGGEFAVAGHGGGPDQAGDGEDRSRACGHAEQDAAAGARRAGLRGPAGGSAGACESW